ncbi:MAG TPA: DUF2795 domain-containing protein, partial [Dehalococcoidia bacterium]|nr:DUF2795 domain-containing protein [Dehalococcoidia bacterium]
LEGLEFPAPKDEIIRVARDKGGHDSEVDQVLQSIENRSYASMDEVEAEVERVYERGGGRPPAGPAASSLP